MSKPEVMSPDDPCPVCGESELSVPFTDVEAVCDACGVVVHDWDDPSLSDEIETTPKPSKGSQIESWSEVRPARNSTQHRFSGAIEVIENISDELAVPPSVRISAAELYVEAAVTKIPEGRSIPTVAAGVLYLAAKAAGEPRPLKRIVDTVDIEQATLSKVVRCLDRELSHGDQAAGIIPAPKDYLTFLCSDLDLTDGALDDAEALLREIDGCSESQGKHPVGVAAAAVYLAVDSPPPQRELAASAGIATETIRKRLNEFRAVLEDTDDV